MSDHFINFAGNEEIELSCTGRTRAGREKEEETILVSVQADDELVGIASQERCMAVMQ